MVVARVDYDKCRACENGAKPNLYHPTGKPDRLGAVCVRSCLARLEEARRLGNAFHAPFRKRSPWKVVRGQLFADSPVGR